MATISVPGSEITIQATDATEFALIQAHLDACGLAIGNITDPTVTSRTDDDANLKVLLQQVDWTEERTDWS